MSVSGPGQSRALVVELRRFPACLAIVGEVGGNFDGDQCAAAGVADNFEAGLCAVEDFEALLHVLHADAGAITGGARIGTDASGSGTAAASGMETRGWLIAAANAGARTIAHSYAVVGHFDEDAIAG